MLVVVVVCLVVIGVGCCSPVVVYVQDSPVPFPKGIYTTDPSNPLAYHAICNTFAKRLFPLSPSFSGCCHCLN